MKHAVLVLLISGRAMLQRAIAAYAATGAGAADAARRSARRAR